MFSWYKYLIVNLVFSLLGFWSGNLFLIAPFPDLCLLVPHSSFFNTLIRTHAPLKISVTQNKVGGPRGYTLSLTPNARTTLSRKRLFPCKKNDIVVIKQRNFKIPNFFILFFYFFFPKYVFDPKNRNKIMCFFFPFNLKLVGKKNKFKSDY